MNLFDLYLQALAWVRRVSRTAHAVIILAVLAFGASIAHGIITRTSGLLLSVWAASVLAVTLALAYAFWKALALAVLKDFRPTGNRITDVLEWLIMVFFLAPLYGTVVLVKEFFE